MFNINYMYIRKAYYKISKEKKKNIEELQMKWLEIKIVLTKTVPGQIGPKYCYPNGHLSIKSLW